jgi:hypothetical protein
LTENINRKKEGIGKRIFRKYILLFNIEFTSFGKFRQFQRRLFESDCVFPKLDIHFYSNDHRGILAKRKIYKDEIILKVTRTY